MATSTRLSLVVVLVHWGACITHAQEAPPATALQRLKAGNERFVADKTSTRNVGAQRRADLAKGQHPFAIVLTCADSRVAPELIFDTGLGDLFVLRVAGNIADPAVVGSIEYAVEHLHVPLIVVVGHESCGAVVAALDGKPLPGDLGWLIKQVKVGDQLPDGKEAKLAAAVRANVANAAADLKLRSKIIAEEVEHKKVAIVSGVYALGTGKVEWQTAEAKKKTAKTDANSHDHPAAKATPAARVNASPTVELYVEPARFPRLRRLLGR
jgi:carbonic anhydrase